MRCPCEAERRQSSDDPRPDLRTLFALSNLWMTRPQFLPAMAEIRLEVLNGVPQTPLSSKSTAAYDPGTRLPHESSVAGDLHRPALAPRRMPFNDALPS